MLATAKISDEELLKRWVDNDFPSFTQLCSSHYVADRRSVYYQVSPDVKFMVGHKFHNMVIGSSNHLDVEYTVDNMSYIENCVKHIDNYFYSDGIRQNNFAKRYKILLILCDLQKYILGSLNVKLFDMVKPDDEKERDYTGIDFMKFYNQYHYNKRYSHMRWFDVGEYVASDYIEDNFANRMGCKIVANKNVVIKHKLKYGDNSIYLRIDTPIELGEIL